MFWVTAALIGWLSSFTLIGTLIWIGIIFVSILFHEYGHALTARAFGQFPRIELVAFGGLTYPEGPRLAPLKEFIVVLCGPLASFLLFVIGTALLQVPQIKDSQAAGILDAFRLINLFWTLVNLFPVLPLDGGQLLRVVLEACFGVKGMKAAMLIGMGLSFAVAAITFFFGWFLVGAIFFLFGFQNIQTWKLARPIAEIDKDESLHKMLLSAEQALFSQNFPQAQKILQELREKTQKGILFISATQYLARLKYHEKDFHGTYELLKSIEADLSDEFSLIMHEVAFACKDYHRVDKLSRFCFQKDPSAFVALRSAQASAALNHPQETVGWLEAALREGVEDFSSFLQSSEFDKVKQEKAFQEFLKSHNL
jgi:stage IV sporulation protein FB